MKIIFLCGCLEPASDGVGDYCRTLSIEMLKQGHQPAIIALNDPFVQAAVENLEKHQGVQLPVLRLPAAQSQTERFSTAKKQIAALDPDWISLQFVIYSFHPKGLPFGLGNKLQQLTKNRRVHIFFHELWVGFTTISSLKHKITGLFQRAIIHSMVRHLQPRAITTTNRLYQLILQRNGIKAGLISLFSNIPVAPLNATFTSSVFATLLIKEQAAGEWIFSGIFGNLYPQAKLESAIGDQLHLAVAKGKKLAFIGFGRVNSEGMAEFERMKAVFSGKIKFLHLGEQPQANVSNLMQMLDVAFSCTPAQHIGKSGVFAAFKLHNVEVILPTAEVIPEYDAETKPYYDKFVKQPAGVWDVAFAAKSYINLLT